MFLMTRYKCDCLSVNDNRDSKEGFRNSPYGFILDEDALRLQGQSERISKGLTARCMKMMGQMAGRRVRGLDSTRWTARVLIYSGQN
jgi:hypothetical protein